MPQQYLKDRVYENLRRKIINCEYAPGVLLNETELIKEFEASRTPIRDALNRLASENLITVIPKKGVIVNGISLKDIAEVLEVRAIIEPQLILLYGDRIDKPTLEDYYKRCLNADQIEAKIRLDEDLHTILYDACTNRYLREILKNVEGSDHRNRIWRSNEGRVNDSIQEHLEITRHLLASHYPEAAESMYQRIMNAKNYAIQKYL